MTETNPYEGLNLPQLLDRMHGIVEPDPVSMLPATDGWWVLAGWLAAVGIILAVQARRRWVANAYRREALAELDALAAPTGHELGLLLRRTALAAFPREKVASLHGDAWAEFLCWSATNDTVVAAAAVDLAGAPYRQDVDPAALVAPARRWIEVHRA
ncbi:MAG: DUF4381 domain-containing protein [Pseudomonadota bacterium]